MNLIEPTDMIGPPPEFPSEKDVLRALSVSPEAAKQLMDHHYAAVRNHEGRLDNALSAAIRKEVHLQRYRNMSIICGTVLALSSLALCAYGIAQHVELTPIAYVLTPVSGLAGVFVWGYRPKDDSVKTAIKPPP